MCGNDPVAHRNVATGRMLSQHEERERGALVGCASPAAEVVIISPGVALSLNSCKVSQASLPVGLEEKVTKGGVGIGRIAIAVTAAPPPLQQTAKRLPPNALLASSVSQ